MPDGSEFQSEGAATLKPREAKVVWTWGLGLTRLTTKTLMHDSLTVTHLTYVMTPTDHISSDLL